VRLKRPLKTSRVPPAEFAQAKPAPPEPAVQRAPARGVTSAARPRGNPASIEYPRRARRRGLEGTVELKIRIDEKGAVAKVVVEKSSGHAILDEAAKSGVARWRFHPALKDGAPVPAWIRRTIRFRLNATP
jgi:protein TonB